MDDIILKVTYENGCIMCEGQVLETEIREQDVIWNEDGSVLTWSPKHWYGYEYQPLFPDKNFTENPTMPHFD